MTTKSWFAVVMLLAVGCGPGGRNGGGDDDNTTDGGPPVCPRCSDDNSAVIDCDGNTKACDDGMLCSMGACANACDAATANHSSVGCDYWAVDMDAAMGPPQDACYAVFVANTSKDPVHIDVSWNNETLAINTFAKLPMGAGTTLTYGAYDNTAGLAPGKVAILFLAEGPPTFNMNVQCPVAAAVGAPAQTKGTGLGNAFHITTDQPVVAYQMLPYGGGKAAATGASLLIPTSAWGTNYVAVTAYDEDSGAPPINIPMGPSMNLVAQEDGTTVTMRPKSAVAGGAGIPTATAGGTWTMMLNKGQYAQITQNDILSGSPVTSDKPIGVFGGHQIMSIDRCCGDHGEQMLTPVNALGSEYVAAPHGDRHADGSADPRIFRIFGAVDGTALTYDPPNTGPATINLGDHVEIRTDGSPFVARSQDAAHPFAMFTYMSGGGDDTDSPGEGDADFVRLVPPPQYLTHYVFFTDPTYPFTTLTVVREKKNGAFEDVTLDCLGTLTDWSPVGTGGDYEISRVKLVDSFNAVGNCNNGVHTMDSHGQFGVWVWGWGANYVMLDGVPTGWVSYGYPAGEAVLPINTVVIQ